MTGLATTLVLGGARSGKSAFAERLVADSDLARIYLATATADDEEMKARIAHHRTQRGESWTTIEEPLALVDALTREATHGRAVLVDCLTLWLTNVLLSKGAPVAAAADVVMAALSAHAGPLVVVSTEVGLGIVPDNELARAFRDHAGRLHQRVAQAADRVVLVVAGLPMEVK